MDLTTCSSDNIIPMNSLAIMLLNQFCMCPAARKLLTEKAHECQTFISRSWKLSICKN